MKYLGAYNLTNDDMKELNPLHPGFSLKQFHKSVKTSNYVDSRGESNLIPHLYTDYQAPGTPFFHQATFNIQQKSIGIG